MVSIHAPARGATRFVFYTPLLVRVSIHAPARGATQQPANIVVFVDVSIHAPARGATFHGGLLQTLGAWFQSTRPRGARQDSGRAAYRARCFNPRAREGRDGVPDNRLNRFFVSIHAPARGATYFALRDIRRREVSIHAPARGATTPTCPSYCSASAFQSTRPRGARPPHC